MKSRRILSIIGLILAAAVLLGIGFAIGRNEVQASMPDATDATDAADDLDNLAHTGNDVFALDITVTKVDDNDSQSFSPEEIGNNFNQGMGYRGVSDVYIYLNRTSERLEDALKNGDITEEEIFFRARQDAREGHCQESFETQHGVSFYTYHYPDYDLRLVYDVFDAPNGKAYPISKMLVFRTSENYHIHPSCDFTDPETGSYLNMEDWGLAFELADITGHSATISCTQSGGQQIGQLKITNYHLYFYSGEDSENGSVPEYEFEISMDGSCRFTIDWSETYGELPSGEYRLGLWISDIYDESQLHPLMDNFRDWQVYEIVFTIP